MRAGLITPRSFKKSFLAESAEYISAFLFALFAQTAQKVAGKANL
jgi:hypothetical protein